MRLGVHFIHAVYPEWRYSRTSRRHRTGDNKPPYGKLFCIKDCAPFGCYHEKEHGYDLSHRGIKVAHAKTVKELKLKAAEIKDQEAPKLEWEYSRNQRRHWSYDRYGEEQFRIIDCAPMYQRHQKEDGYDMLLYGKKIAHAKTVKELKLKAAETKGEKS